MKKEIKSSMDVKLTFITKDNGKTWQLEGGLPGTELDDVLMLMAQTQLPSPDDERFKND